jgi:hypothetical protein
MIPDNIIQLGEKICSHQASIDEISEFITHLLSCVIDNVNNMFAPRQLIKKDRSTEPLPTDKRQLSSYRTRLGTMLEYAMSSYLDDLIHHFFWFKFENNIRCCSRISGFLYAK